jgi:hypothetical protein
MILPKKLSIAVSIVAVALAVVLVAPKSAHSRDAVRGQGADERENNRYTQESCTTTTIAGENSILFPAVPSSRRLVVIYTSMEITIPHLSTVSSIRLSSGSLNRTFLYAQLQTSSASGTRAIDSFIVSSPVVAYFEQGAIPQINFLASAAIGLSACATLAGYTAPVGGNASGLIERNGNATTPCSLTADGCLAH